MARHYNFSRLYPNKARLRLGYSHCKSSRLQMFFKIGVLKNFAIFTVRKSLFNKAAGLQAIAV